MAEDFMQRVALILNREGLLDSRDFRMWCEGVHDVLTPREAAEQWRYGQTI